MHSFSDFEKIIIVFFVSVLFAVVVLAFFHFFRRIRKDKLISKFFLHPKPTNLAQITMKTSKTIAPISIKGG